MIEITLLTLVEAPQRCQMSSIKVGRISGGDVGAVIGVVRCERIAHIETAIPITVMLPGAADSATDNGSLGSG